MNSEARARRPQRGGMLLGALALAAVGCGVGERFPLAPARGEFLLEGKPLAIGRVMFSPIAKEGELESGRPAMGDLGADGSFTLATHGEPGAVIGRHRVSWINTDKKTDAGRALGVERVAYPSAVEVTADGENHFRIEMKRADFARFGRKIE